MRVTYAFSRALYLSEQLITYIVFFVIVIPHMVRLTTRNLRLRAWPILGPSPFRGTAADRRGTSILRQDFKFTFLKIKIVIITRINMALHTHSDYMEDEIDFSNWELLDEEGNGINVDSIEDGDLCIFGVGRMMMALHFDKSNRRFFTFDPEPCPEMFALASILLAL